MIRWSGVTAVFGGTFDPPHLGHRVAIQGLFTEPGVERVVVMPSPLPPHKEATVEASHRIAMCRLAFAGLPDVTVDPREIERAQRNPGSRTYSYDTLEELGREIPRDRLAFVVGTDQLEKLSQWSRFPALLGLCNWIVLLRKPSAEIQAASALGAWQGSGILGREIESGCWQLTGRSTVLKLVATEAAALSSTQVREEIALKGQISGHFIDPAVDGYLKTHRLYGSG